CRPPSSSGTWQQKNLSWCPKLLDHYTQLGEKWSPAEMRIAGMIWGHSSKSGQLYATPIETIVAELLY
ncbi:hypothetical protein ACEN88_03715, partial [Massilia sp. CT11-108]|uniref:hypothetical protein n=1 Tax=Massilia sp. CT11-108 TaxID=3393900 RepID=UPI0039A64642